MSVSSLDSSVPSSLPAKYEKLASEYAKVRAQVGVLKKALVDEQNQTAELKELLKVKDQDLRKADQELDSFNCRNMFLLKRIRILQNDLDALENTSKSSEGKKEDDKGAIIMEELQKKISENAALVSALHDQTEKYENEKFELNQKIEIHEHKINEYETKLSFIEQTKLAKYENENKLLLSKLNAKEEEIKKLHSEIKKLKDDFNGKSIALNNSSFKENFSEFIKSLALHELFTLLSQFFQQVEFRYSKYLEDKEFQKFLEINQKNRLFLQDFVDKYLLYSNNHIEQDFLFEVGTLYDDIESYILVLEGLTEQLNLSKDIEVASVIKDIICKFQKHWKNFNSILQTSQSPGLSQSECEEIVGKFADVFRSFRSTCDYFLSVFNEKFKSNSINEESEKEILSILTRMSMQSTVVYKMLTDKTTLLVQVLEYHIMKMKHKSTVSQSEACCEHWKQEFELLKTAFGKKVKSLEEQVSCLSEATTPRSSNSTNFMQSSFEDQKEPLERFNGWNSPSDIQAVGDEAEIIKYFNARANKLVADRQYAESKVTTYKDECETLQKRLEHSLEGRLLLEDLVKQLKSTVSKLEEELRTTTLNYEIQLQSMSEHMANMNEKFASQEEQIEILKYQLSEKENKRGK